MKTLKEQLKHEAFVNRLEEAGVKVSALRESIKEKEVHLNNNKPIVK